MLHFNSLNDPTLKSIREQGGLQNGTWLTIGSFDGVHRGHQAILRRLTEGARANEGMAMVLTFHPHPSVVLRGRTGQIYLSSPNERAELMGALGVYGMVTEPFTRELASRSARDFVGQLVETLHLRHLLVGHDFALGRNREGNLPALQELGKEMGFMVNVMHPVRVGGEVVSSSRVRNALAEGDVREARRLLGRPYSVSGSVVPGDGRGRTIGIPTANLDLDPERILPRVGVYACLACVEGGEMCKAVTNIGLRPTFTGGQALPRLETHIMDYSGDLYGKRVRVAFLARLRDEQRFSGIDALVAQIHADIRKARRILRVS